VVYRWYTNGSRQGQDRVRTSSGQGQAKVREKSGRSQGKIRKKGEEYLENGVAAFVTFVPLVSLFNLQKNAGCKIKVTSFFFATHLQC
jgi:hypothetical protein